MITDGFKKIFISRIGLLALLSLLLIVLISLPDFKEKIVIKKIMINKSLQYVEKRELDVLLEQALEKDFFSLEIKDIAQTVNQIPWVKTAQVKKIWPDSILVAIQEQTPVARWGETQLVSANGEIFAPGDLKEFDHLPHLMGTESQRDEVSRFYDQAARILLDVDLNITVVDMVSTFEWRIQLDNGLLLILSSRQGLEKIYEFRDIYQEYIFPKLERIAHVDLRYDSGFAVAWGENDENIQGKSLALR